MSDRIVISPVDRSVGALIRRRMAELGMTRTDLAFVSGISGGHLGRIIADSIGPSARVAVLLGTALDVDPLEILCLHSLALLARIAAGDGAANAGRVERRTEALRQVGEMDTEAAQ